ncbi:MAG: hypothetical protein ABIF17_01035 [Patescibacteria group bacterium]
MNVTKKLEEGFCRGFEIDPTKIGFSSFEEEIKKIKEEIEQRAVLVRGYINDIKKLEEKEIGGQSVEKIKEIKKEIILKQTLADQCIKEILVLKKRLTNKYKEDKDMLKTILKAIKSDETPSA